MTAATAGRGADQSVGPAPRRPRVPPAARCGPTSLLVASFLPIVGAYAVDSWQVGGVSVLLIVVLAPLAVTAGAATAVRVFPVAVAALSLGWSAWLFGGGDTDLGDAIRAGSRVLVLALPGVLLAGSIVGSVLGDQLGQWFRVPARPVVAAMAAVERLDALAEQTRELVRLRRVRGLSPGWSPVARARSAAQVVFAVLVGTIRDAGRTAVAMEARGLGQAHRRTWAEPARWHRADSVMVAVGAVSAAVPAVLSALTPW